MPGQGRKKNENDEKWKVVRDGVIWSVEEQ
jgi:hypothetical protein